LSWSLLFPASKPKSGRNSTYPRCSDFPSQLSELKPGTDEYGILERDYRHAYRDALKSLLDYETKLRHYSFDQGSGTAAMIEANPVANNALTIAQLAETYTAEKQRADSWVPKTILEKSDHIALLNEALGETTTLDTLNALSARKVKEVLSHYPKNRSKNPATRGKSLEEVIKLVGVDRIQVPTINKYLQTYSDMFEWAHKNGLIEKNHFSGLAIRVRRDRKHGRSAFSPDQMASILRVVTDETSPLTGKAYRKWGPLIGAYTGARLNEIAQLALSDFIEKDGIWCFDINDAGDGKHLKTTAAKRIVPVHPQLIELGLLDYVESMKKKQCLKLFPDFSYSPNNGWGRTLGRWFNESLLPALRIKSEDLVFHSLRHTVITHLSQAGVDQTFVKAIVGHQQAGVTQQVYFKAGYTVAQLSDALSKLKYDY
jgi:integrase